MICVYAENFTKSKAAVRYVKNIFLDVDKAYITQRNINPCKGRQSKILKRKHKQNTEEAP